MLMGRMVRRGSPGLPRATSLEAAGPQLPMQLLHEFHKTRRQRSFQILLPLRTELRAQRFQMADSLIEVFQRHHTAALPLGAFPLRIVGDRLCKNTHVLHVR